MRAQAQREERIRRWCKLPPGQHVTRTRRTNGDGTTSVSTVRTGIGTNYRQRQFLWFKWLEPI